MSIDTLTKAAIRFVNAVGEATQHEKLIDAAADYARALEAFQAQRGTASRAAPAGAVFPNYGRSKGAPVAGASRQDLEYYAAGARRTLADESKARFHDKERALLAAIEAELGKTEPSF